MRPEGLTDKQHNSNESIQIINTYIIKCFNSIPILPITKAADMLPVH